MSGGIPSSGSHPPAGTAPNLEAALHDAEERHRALLARVAQGVIYQDIEGRITAANGVAERILGLSLEQLRSQSTVGPPWHAIREDGSALPADGHPAIVALRSGREVRGVVIGVPRRSEATHRWIRIDAVPLLSAGGLPYAVCSVFEEIGLRASAEVAAHRGEEWLRLAVEAAALGLWARELESGHFEASDRARALLGVPPGADLDHWTALEMVHPDDRERIGRLVEDAVARRGAYSAEFRTLAADGTLRWIAARGQVFEPGAGEHQARLIGVVQEITERKRAEEERLALLAQEREARLRAEASAAQAALLHAVTAALAGATTPQEVAAAILGQGLAILGAQQGSVVELSGDGTTLETLGTLGYAEPVTAGWECFPLDTPLPLAESARRGETIILSSPEEAAARYPELIAYTDIKAWVTFPLLAAGRVVGAVGLSLPGPRDMTDAERALIGTLARQCGQALERARLFEAEQRGRALLLAERDRLRQVLDTLPVGVVIADAAGQVVALNQAGQGLSGLDMREQGSPQIGEEAYGHYGVRRADGQPYAAGEQPLARSLRAGDVVRDEQEILRQPNTGRDIPLLVSSAPLRDQSGSIVGAVAAYQDLTGLKRLEQAREEFLGAAAHDLKTPLTAIQGQAQLARRRLSRLNPEGVEAIVAQLASIGTAAGRMASLIEGLIDITRLQMGTLLELRRQPTDLVALAKGAVAQQEGITAHRLRLEMPVSELVARVDATRIERVLSNLIANAIKYSSGDSEIVVRLGIGDIRGVPYALLTVADQGIGIPAEDLPHIFTRFYRASNVGDSVPGTGIGLASARQIVEQHGGSIEVASREGSGSTFTVHLPLGAGGA